MMDIEEVYDNLCHYDPRSDYYQDMLVCMDAKDIPRPRGDCACDNCFHGRDRLAMEIIKLKTKE